MDAKAQPLKIAILAMGGEGGGVLADWVVDLGEHNGHIAQTTSVPGVAQRTGATIYYVELFPAAAAEQAGAAPVLALMPLPGDVDIVLASELMEAGRAVQRGLVTPDRTTLIASTHRVYAIAEKIAMGDGRADDATLLAAEQSGSVISAVIFGTLAGTGLLPFTRAQFEATIGRGGVGVKPSLKAFGAAFEHASHLAPAASATVSAAMALPRSPHPEVQALIERAAKAFEGAALTLVLEGLRRLVDYQDPAYAALYLERLDKVRAVVRGGELTQEVARHLALWMSYEDTIRVADLKTRGSRFERVRDEVKAAPGQMLAINEYMHPRLQEIADTMPAGLGRWLLASGTPRRWVERLASKGRVVRTSSLRGYLMLTFLAMLRRWRRSTLRFVHENGRIEAWLAEIHHVSDSDPALATEIARCQRLVKGYGDTHERGLRNYALLRSAWQRGGPRMTAALLAELRQAALADEHGKALATALQQHALA
jgi:indolepyruvate ferredoxin oxidoreductase beta subunit